MRCRDRVIFVNERSWTHKKANRETKITVTATCQPPAPTSETARNRRA